jgi:hypothetical protein
MTTTEEYNGWPNYETWLVNLWLTNEEPIYRTSRATARAAGSDRQAGEAIKDTIPELLDFPTTGMAADLVNAAMSRVDWVKIGESLREE